MGDTSATDQPSVRWKKRSKTYAYPELKWWQLIKKRRWAKRMQRFSKGDRIKMSEHGMYFTDEFTVHSWVSVERTEGDTDTDVS